MRRTVISKLKSSQKIGGLPSVNFDKGQTVLKLRLYLVLTWQDPIKQCYLPLNLSSAFIETDIECVVSPIKLSIL